LSEPEDLSAKKDVVEEQVVCNRIFKEREANFKKKAMKNMTLADQLEYKNPQVLAEYSQEIYDNMIKQEPEFMVEPDYLSKTQDEIKDTSRAFLIEWIIDVHRKFRLVPEALYVCILIVDQFLSKKKILKS
jgi:hypothetical protein